MLQSVSTDENPYYILWQVMLHKVTVFLDELESIHVPHAVTQQGKQYSDHLVIPHCENTPLQVK